MRASNRRVLNAAAELILKKPARSSYIVNQFQMRFPSYEGSSVKHQNLSLSGRKPNSDLSRRVLRQPRIRWDISSQTTFPYSGEEFFSGGATL